MGFHLHTGVDSTAVIDGFTITNAYDTSFYGAAVVCDDASPTIRNCVITGNDCSGILCVCWSRGPRIENCTITYNAGYAGIDLEFGAIHISGSVIAFNDGYGAFLYTHPASLTEVSHSVFRGNNGYAGLLVTQSMSWYNVLVFNCTFVDNNIGFYADWMWPKVNPTGIEPDTPYVGSVNNNVFTFNREEGIDWLAHPDQFDYNVYCNNSFGNDAGDWPDTTRGPGDPYGNLSRDPLFCDTAAGAFHVAEESPCAPANNSCAVLMGAFGTACTCCENRGNVDRMTGPGGPVDVADLTYLISYLFQGGPEPPCPEEGNVDSGLGPGGPIDVGDVTYLVAYLFQGGPAPPPCP
jgi:hypothetical protein